MSGGRVLHGEDGVEAWAEAVNKRLTNLERSAQLISASVGSGGIIVKDGGQITFLDTIGAALVTVDENGLLVAGSPVRLDGDGLDVANGLVTVDDSGLMVGSDVIVDSTGLRVIGGYVTPSLWQRYAGSVTNTSLNTTDTDKITLNVTPPSWAETMICQLLGVGGFSNGSGGTQNLRTQFRVGTNAAFGSLDISAPNGQTMGATNFSSITEGTTGISLPSAFDVRMQASVNTGTNASNHLRFTALIEFGRS